MYTSNQPLSAIYLGEQPEALFAPPPKKNPEYPHAYQWPKHYWGAVKEMMGTKNASRNKKK